VSALELSGLPVAACADADSALEWLATHRPSVILFDFPHLPSAEDSAWSSLRAIRAHASTSGVPMLVVGTLEKDEEVQRLFEEGADDYLRKPLSGGEIVAHVRGQLKLRGTVDELARRSRDAELLVELTQALASSLDLREILYTVVDRIAEVVRVDRVSIVLVRENDDRAFVVVSSDDRTLRDLPIDLARYPEIEKALAERQPLVIHDAATHPIFTESRKSRPSLVTPPSDSIPFASLAIVPLMFEDRPMGVLFLRARASTTFDDRALSLCKTLANATAVGLRNARILQSLRDQTQQITFARYEAERRMRAVQRYADFFESIDDGVCVMDQEGKLLFANPRAEVLTGYTQEEMKGRKLKDLVAPEDQPLASELRNRPVGGREQSRGVDLRIRRKDGVMRIFSLTQSSVLHEEGAILLTLRDVTVEREQALELAQTKEFLEHLIDSSVDAIVSSDMKGRIILFNRAAERVYGLSAREVLGTSVERLYPKGRAREVMALIRSDEFGGKGRLEGYRTEVLSATGEVVPITLSAALITRGDRPIGTVGIFTDLRERIRIEQRLAHAQEQLRVQEKQTIVAELAGAAAHELNQPLTSVMGYAELLRRRLEPGTPQHHAADIIVSEAERMAEIVRKIGKITKYETKTYVGTARILDLDRASRDDDPRTIANREPAPREGSTSSNPPSRSSASGPPSGGKTGGRPGGQRTP